MGHTNPSGWVMIFFYTKVTIFENLNLIGKIISCSEALIYRVIYLFGPPRWIVCDKVAELTSAIIQAILTMLNCRLKVIISYNHCGSKCKRQIKMISDIIVKHLWDKGQVWPLFATTAAYAMNTFTSEALSSFSPFQLVFLWDPPDLRR